MSEIAHLTNYDLERYYRRIYIQQPEIEKIAEHVDACAACFERLEAAGRYVRALEVLTGAVEYAHEVE